MIEFSFTNGQVWLFILGWFTYSFIKHWWPTARREFKKLWRK